MVEVNSNQKVINIKAEAGSQIRLEIEKDKKAWAKENVLGVLTQTLGVTVDWGVPSAFRGTFTTYIPNQCKTLVTFERHTGARCEHEACLSSKAGRLQNATWYNAPKILQFMQNSEMAVGKRIQHCCWLTLDSVPECLPPSCSSFS